MSVDIRIEPGRVITADEFVGTHPPYSIALDGYVRGKPFLVTSPAGPFRNFNHHEAVDRSCTCATCEQVRRAVLLGLYALYRGADGRPCAQVWVNDCDQDICLATWILMHPERAGDPLVRTLANVEDLLDMSAGGIPFPKERELLAQVRWVFEPYTERRPEMANLSPQQMLDIIAIVHERIEAFLSGNAGELPLLGDYTVIGGGPGWSLVEVNHQHARQKMVAAGISAAIELYARSGDHFVYSVWRRSEYIVEFPVREVLRALNEAEGRGADEVEGWGGSGNVGGSPRTVGSSLAPKQVEQVVNQVVARHKRPATAQPMVVDTARLAAGDQRK